MFKTRTDISNTWLLWNFLVERVIKKFYFFVQLLSSLASIFFTPMLKN